MTTQAKAEKAKKEKRGNGEGAWTYDETKKLYQFRVTINGKRRSFYGRTKTQCRDKRDEAIEAAKMGLVTLDRRQTVEQFINQWMQTRKSTVRPQTWLSDDSSVRCRILPSLGKVRLLELTPQHLQELYRALQAGEVTKRKLSPASVQRTHALLHKALGQAVKWNLIPRNPCDAAERPTVHREEMRVLTATDVRQLADAASRPVLRSLYIIAALTGLRRGELIALGWDAIDFNRGTLAVRRNALRLPGGGFRTGDPKTKAGRRTMLLSAVAVEELKRRKAEQNAERLKAGAAWEQAGLVFTTERGTALDAANVTRAFKRDLVRAGLDPAVRLHDLRHTAATLLIEQGVDFKTVQATLGHATFSVTMDLYAHVTPAMHQSVAAAMDRAFEVGA